MDITLALDFLKKGEGNEQDALNNSKCKRKMKEQKKKKKRERRNDRYQFLMENSDGKSEISREFRGRRRTGIGHAEGDGERERGREVHALLDSEKPVPELVTGQFNPGR